MFQNSPGKLSFVVDCWTSPNQVSYQGVIVTFVNKEWELEHIVLDVTPLDSAHTGTNLCTAFTGLLESFEIQNKMLAITMDNASNMASFCKRLAEYFGKMVSQIQIKCTFT